MNKKAWKKFQKEKIQPWFDRFDGMEQKERAMVSVLSIMFVGFIWMTFLYDPTVEAKIRTGEKINDLNTLIAAHNDAIQTIQKRGSFDPNDDLKKKRESIRARLAHLDEQLDEFTVDHISANQMVFVLEEVLTDQTNLQLNSMESEEAEPVVKTLQDLIDDGRSARNMYRHGVSMEFSGDYFSTLEYLQMMEQLSWDFFWDDFEYDVSEYPDAKVRIRIHTLSGEESWLGV